METQENQTQENQTQENQTQENQTQEKQTLPEEPSPRGTKRPDAPPSWPERFLKAYRKNGNISHSATLARVDRRTVHRTRERDPDFAALMEDAQEEAADALEQEARRRAVEGTLRPVYQQGKEVGQIREYSDTLLIVMLKGQRPEKYRENARVEHTGANGGPIAIREVIIERPGTERPQPGGDGG